MNIADITEKIRGFLIDEFEIDSEKIYDTALKTDMGIDSLDFVDIVVIVKDIFGIKLTIEDIKQIDTFGEFCQYIQQKTERNN